MRIHLFALFLVHALFLTSRTYGQTLDYQIVLDDPPARIIELKAILTATNTSNIPVRRFVARVSIPPNDVGSQRSLLIGSDVRPSSIKTHKSGVGQYLEFEFPLAPGMTIENNVRFQVLVVPVDYLKAKRLRTVRGPTEVQLQPYLQPEPYVESDSPEVQAAAREVFNRGQTELDQAIAAYEYTAKALKFSLVGEKLGAQKALQVGTGDCTEHRCVFIALCRSQELPARFLNVFNLGPNKSIAKSQPNHDIAEVYLPSHGWIPVDAQMGKGRHDLPVGFGKLSNNYVILTRGTDSIYSTWLPPENFRDGAPRPAVDFSISWEAAVLQEGAVKTLYREFVRRK